MDVPEWLANHISEIVAGVCGGLVRTMTDPTKSWKKALADVFVGGILAVYLGPIAGRILLPGFEFAEIDTTKAHSLGAFLAGFGGMVFIELIDGVWRRRSLRVAKEIEGGDGE